MIIVNYTRINSSINYKNNLEKINKNLYTNGKFVYKEEKFLIEKESYNSYPYEKVWVYIPILKKYIPKEIRKKINAILGELNENEKPIKEKEFMEKIKKLEEAFNINKEYFANVAYIAQL